MVSKYTYVIKVEFNRRIPECRYKDVHAKYIGCKGNTDLFHFTQKWFTITADRQHKYVDGTILTSSTNTLNSQLLKGLLFCYGLASDLPSIHNISIDLYSKGKLIHSYQECKDFVQPLISNGHKNYRFSPQQLELIFDSTLKASAIRIALSYWLKAVDTNSSYQRFDCLWRSFGRIYLYNGNTKSDTTGQIKIRVLLINNIANFPTSISLAKQISLAEVESFRWRKLILHEYKTMNKMPALKAFIERYTDGRIMKAMEDGISVRVNYLLNYEKNNVKCDLWNPPIGIKNWLMNHFNDVNDIEIITIICIKYAYFLRNQYFHGEIPENTFKVKTSNEDNELEIINQLLECLIYELILHNKILRD